MTRLLIPSLALFAFVGLAGCRQCKCPEVSTHISHDEKGDKMPPYIQSGHVVYFHVLAVPKGKTYFVHFSPESPCEEGNDISGTRKNAPKCTIKAPAEKLYNYEFCYQKGCPETSTTPAPPEGVLPSRPETPLPQRPPQSPGNIPFNGIPCRPVCNLVAGPDEAPPSQL